MESVLVMDRSGAMVAHTESLGQLSAALMRRGWRLATAESCTGGMLSGLLTSRPGSSSWFDCGFVTYSNAAKTRMLDVPTALLECLGAVSPEVVEAMAMGVLRRSGADVAVAISGIAGPGGEVPGKPVGTVFIAWGDCDGGLDCQHFLFSGDREGVRRQAVDQSILGLLARYG